MECNDPAGVTTSGGALRTTLSAQETYNLSYQGGLVTTWNKVCLHDGRISQYLSRSSFVLPAVYSSPT
ncbi:hypothetical protein C8F04DRAFT_1082169 [Mycena alexandri]|uniref:Uncharacterized protein n=1 Tax=Mycena alexandri TaxID=1745969 RepID=A0AAD6TBC0_9AGAR|nr:hypothetical protein C8F04DRAFT_1082169 [Mycena alexandri]